MIPTAARKLVSSMGQRAKVLVERHEQAEVNLWRAVCLQIIGDAVNGADSVGNWQRAAIYAEINPDLMQDILKKTNSLQ